MAITYKAASGSTYPSGSNAEGATRTVSFILAPGGSSTRYEGNSGGDLGPTFGKFSGSARISASGPVVAIVNQTQTTFTSNQKPSGTYNAARIDRLTQKAAVPLVQADFYGYYTSMACANASTTQAATVEFRYLSDSLSANPGVKATRTVTIPAGASIWAYERDRNGPLAHINTTTSPWYNPTLGTARFNGSAVVTSRTDGANIMCVVNEVGDSILYDNMNTYNGVAVLNSTGN